MPCSRSSVTRHRKSTSPMISSASTASASAARRFRRSRRSRSSKWRPHRPMAQALSFASSAVRWATCAMRRGGAAPRSPFHVSSSTRPRDSRSFAPRDPSGAVSARSLRHSRSRDATCASRSCTTASRWCRSRRRRRCRADSPACGAAPFAERLVPVDDVQGAIHVSGLIERPADVGTAGRRLFLTVNGRAIRDHGIVRAAEQAYRSTIPAGARPTLCLDVVVPADLVDVNVHPMKAEVRFRDRWMIERAVEHCVRHALGGSASAATVGPRIVGVSDRVRGAADRWTSRFSHRRRRSRRGCSRRRRAISSPRRIRRSWRRHPKCRRSCSSRACT